MTLAPLSIATAGYVCGTGPRAISIATQGYVCLAVVTEEVGVHPPGMGISAERKRRILEEDELLIAVIMAFLQIKDD